MRQDESWWHGASPGERFYRAGVEQAEAEALVHHASDLRALVCAELHSDGWSFSRIAIELGLSRSRVQQLVTRGRAVQPPTEVEVVAEPELVAAEPVADVVDLAQPEPVSKLRRQIDSRTAATFYTWVHPVGVHLEARKRRYPDGKQRWELQHLEGSAIPAAAEHADPVGDAWTRLGDLRADLDRLAKALELGEG